MSISVEQIDGLLADALRSESPSWPADWKIEPVLDAIEYHGVAGLLNEQVPSGWPSTLQESIQRQTLVRSMWELRHQAVLSDLLARFKSPALLLKGTALAYGLYSNPAARARGDTDVLIRASDRQAARAALAEAGFRRATEAQDLPEALRAQESWTLRVNDGSSHCIDLHSQVLNSPALYGAFEFDELWAGRRSLPSLGEAAFAPASPMLLAHACVHRAFHECAPYFIGDRTFFGGDRLIWLFDIALLGRAMTEDDWSVFAQFAADRGFSQSCADAIDAAERRLGPICPVEVREALGRGSSSAYLHSGQLGRAARDFWAVPGVARKSHYALARLLPSGDFMRAKYADMQSQALPLLYLRRMTELMRRRPARRAGP